MFVRWKRRPMSRGKRLTGEKALSAVLVVSARVDGRPRQRVIGHLATIQEHGIPHYWHRVGFWEAATEYARSCAPIRKGTRSGTRQRAHAEVQGRPRRWTRTSRST